MEIERKYLVRELPADLDSYPHVEIEQGYLCTSPTLRIRRMGDAYILTVKERIPQSNPDHLRITYGSHSDHLRTSTAAAIVNREEEFSLSADNYNLLKSKCDGNLVCKTRYRIPLSISSSHLPGSVGDTACDRSGAKIGEGDRSEGVVEEYVAELDLFHGLHEGLRLVEVEFPTTEAADRFTPPSWFGPDVSSDSRYRNSWLAFNNS